MTRARDLADSADKDIAGTLTLDDLTVDNNVGIGTTSPTFGASGFGLEVKGTGRPTVRVTEETNTHAVQLSAIDGAAILESRSSGMDLVFGTSGAEKMRIDDTNGYAQINSASQIRLSLGNAGTPGTNTANWIRGSGNSLGLNAASDNIHFEIGGNEKFKISASGGALFNSGQDINQNFHVKSSGNANSLFIDGNGGNVGIGTSSPDQELHIKVGNGGIISSGAAREGAVIRLEHDQQWESGYGGSGSDFLGALEFATGDTSTGVGVRAAIKTTVDNYYNTNSLTFYTAPAATAGILERMRIDSAGRVTMPYQPSFYAYPSSSTVHTYNQWNTVAFNTTGWNVGGHFNT